MTPGAGAAAIAAAVLDEDEARFFGDEIVAAAAAAAAPEPAASAAAPTSLADLAARFRRAFPPGHARFSACSAAVLTLEATRRAPPPAALDPGQRAALWYCVWAAFREGDGDDGGQRSSTRLALNPFLPLMLRAVLSSSSSGPFSSSSSSSSSAARSGPALPERAYLLRLLAAPPDDVDDPSGADDGHGGGLHDHLPPSAAVAQVEAESIKAARGGGDGQGVDAEALCARWRRAAAAAAAAAAARRAPAGQHQQPHALLAGVPWQRPEPRPLPPVPGELRWLYPPLVAVECCGGGGDQQEGRQEQRQRPQQAPPFLWDGAMGAEEEDEGGDDDAAPPPAPALALREARELVARALRGPLPPSQERRVLAALEAEDRGPSSSSLSSSSSPPPPLVVRLGVEPQHVPQLVEHVPGLAHGLLASIAAARARHQVGRARARAFFAALAHDAPVAEPSLEVVHRLSSAGAGLMPVMLLRAYVARCLAACEQMAGEAGGGGMGGAGGPLDGATARFVRLVCVFLTALVKSGALWVAEDEQEEREEEELDALLSQAAGATGAEASPSSRPPAAAAPSPPDDGDPLSHELRAFCVSLSRVREAAALFSLLVRDDG
jgi:hypothetical protein